MLQCEKHQIIVVLQRIQHIQALYPDVCQTVRFELGSNRMRVALTIGNGDHVRQVTMRVGKDVGEYWIFDPVFSARVEVGLLLAFLEHASDWVGVHGDSNKICFVDAAATFILSAVALHPFGGQWSSLIQQRWIAGRWGAILAGIRSVCRAASDGFVLQTTDKKLFCHANDAHRSSTYCVSGVDWYGPPQTVRIPSDVMNLMRSVFVPRTHLSVFFSSELGQVNVVTMDIWLSFPAEAEPALVLDTNPTASLGEVQVDARTLKATLKAIKPYAIIDDNCPVTLTVLPHTIEVATRTLPYWGKQTVTCPAEGMRAFSCMLNLHYLQDAVANIPSGFCVLSLEEGVFMVGDRGHVLHRIAPLIISQ